MPLLVTIATRVERLLTRRGVVDGGDGLGLDAWDPFADEAPTLAGLAASSVRGVAAMGPRAGRPVRRWGSEVPDDGPRPCHARVRSLDLNAAVTVRAGARDRLERMCQHALRPAVAFDETQATPSLVEGWGRSDCASRRMGRWYWTCAADGRMARRSWCLIRSSFWSVWRRWYHGHGSTWSCTTGCWRRVRPRLHCAAALWLRNLPHVICPSV